MAFPQGLVVMIVRIMMSLVLFLCLNKRIDHRTDLIDMIEDVVPFLMNGHSLCVIMSITRDSEFSSRPDTVEIRNKIGCV